MNIYIGGNPLDQNDDNTAIYSQPNFMPPLSKLESFPNIKKMNIAKFVEHLYFITMERNGFSYFYPNLETSSNLCRFEWHYDYLGNPYELRLGLSFKVANSKITDIGYYVVPHEHYKKKDDERKEYSIDGNEYEKIKQYIHQSIEEANTRIELELHKSFNILYYIELNVPVLDLIELATDVKVLPSRLVDGKIVSAVVINKLGHSYLSAKRFGDERVNLTCALLSLILDKAKLVNMEKLPSHISPPDKTIKISDVNYDDFYPEIKEGMTGIKQSFTKSNSEFITKIIEIVDNLNSEKAKRKIVNIAFSYYSARETEAINKTVALVSYVACLDAIAKEYCPQVRDEHGSRKALVQTIVKLLSYSEQEGSIDKWSKKIYNDHRSSYVHGANIRFEEFSQNMDGKNFAGLPKAIPTESKPVSKQYEYESDYRALKEVSLAVLIRYIEVVSNVSLTIKPLKFEINFSGASVPEAHVGMPNKGWVKLT
jgi:hypothetical protein